MTETLKVTLVKSGIGRNKKIRRTLIGLGLTRMHQNSGFEELPAVRG
jgi:large subunit ribosomal protein L30